VPLIASFAQLAEQLVPPVLIQMMRKGVFCTPLTKCAHYAMNANPPPRGLLDEIMRTFAPLLLRCIQADRSFFLDFRLADIVDLLCKP
jgi:hypothetical protein